MNRTTTAVLMALSIAGMSQLAHAQSANPAVLFTCSNAVKFPTSDESPSAISFADASPEFKTQGHEASWARYNSFDHTGDDDVLPEGGGTPSNAPDPLLLNGQPLSWFGFGGNGFYAVTPPAQAIGDPTSTPPGPSSSARYANNNMYFFNYPFYLSQAVDLTSFNLKLIGLAANDQLVRIYINNQAVSPSQTIADLNSSATAVTPIPFGGGAAPQWVHGQNNLSFAILDTDVSNNMGLQLIGAELTGSCDPVVTPTAPATLLTGASGTFAGQVRVDVDANGDPITRIPDATPVTIDIVDGAGVVKASFAATVDANGAFTTTQPVNLPVGTYATRMTVGDAAPNQMVLADLPLTITDGSAPASSINLTMGTSSAAQGASGSFSGMAMGLPAGTAMAVEIVDAQGTVVQTLSATPTAADGSFTATGTLTAAPGANYLVRATALVNGSPVISNTLPLTITAAVTPPVAGATPVPATGWLGLLLLSLGMGAAGLMGRKRQPR